MKWHVKIFWNYFLYILEHKWNVFLECLKIKQPLHGLVHDFSKFRPSEFFPYANFFFKKDRAKSYNIKEETDEDFQKGWFYHQKRNKHHWNYWVSVTRVDEIIAMPMPNKYIFQMLADWRAMSKKFGSSTKQYYLENNQNMILHSETKKKIEGLLKI